MSHFPEVICVARAAAARLATNRALLLCVRSRLVLLVALAFRLPLLPAPVVAQDARLLVVADSDVSAAMARNIKRRLRSVGDILDEADFRSAARADGLEPGSDAALTQIAPRSGAQVIVHLSIVADGKLRVEFRSGRAGEVLLSRTLALLREDRLKFPARAQHQLAVAANHALAANQASSQSPAALPSGAAAATSSSSASSTAEHAGRSGASAAAAPTTISEDEELAAASNDSGGQGSSESASEEILDDPELSARLAAAPAATDDDAPPQGFALRASVGLGPGTHSLLVPTPGMPGAYGELDTGIAPAIQFSAAAQLSIGHWLLRAEGQYRRFFGVEPAPVPVPPPSDMSDANSMSNASGINVAAPVSSVRSQSLVVGASPGYRFGGSQSALLTVMVGWTYRDLRPAIVTLPAARFSGVVVRPALHIPLGEGVFCLHFAPELIVVQASQSNAQDFMATRAHGGLGFGAEASLDVQLTKPIGVGIEYRYSRVSVTRAAGGPAIDKEWYVALQAVLLL